MRLELSKIQSPRERFDYTWPASTLDTSDDEFEVVEPIRLELEVQKAGDDRFRLVGRARTVLEVPCSRCLEPYSIPIDSAFDLSYLPQADNAGHGEHEIRGDDLSTVYYRGGVIELSELLREQFYLALPMKPLCTEDCRGLCPQCGTNLNRVTCDCKPVWEDPRLGGLKGLLDERKSH
jgi:uncharacterized protein